MARLINDESLRQAYAEVAVARAAFFDVKQSNQRLYECLEDIRSARRKIAA